MVAESIMLTVMFRWLVCVESLCSLKTVESNGTGTIRHVPEQAWTARTGYVTAATA